MSRPPDEYDYADGLLADARGREAEPTTDEIRILEIDVSRTPVAGDGPFTVLDRTERLYVSERSGGGDDLFEIAVDGDQLLYAFAKGIGRVGPGPPPFQ